MSFLSDAVSGLMSSLQAAGGESVTYQYGDYPIVLNAVKGETDFQVETHSGAYEHVRSHDWIVKAAELSLNGQTLEPRKGDTIEWDNRVYEVMPVGNREIFEYLDPYRKIMRIHSKLRLIYGED